MHMLSFPEVDKCLNFKPIIYVYSTVTFESRKLKIIKNLYIFWMQSKEIFSIKFHILKVQSVEQNITTRIEKEHTAALDMLPLDTKAPTINSRAARSPIFDSMARFIRFLAASTGFFFM